MKKITAKAPANIAFVKYWGKKDAALKTPLTDSFSMTIDQSITTTTVAFDTQLTRDEVFFDGKVVSGREEQKVIEHLDRIRALGKNTLFARVYTKNSFPSGAGVASSASGFAALTLAAASALALTLSTRQLSILARLGSGSASRSIPDGFVWWHAGTDSDSSYAESLFPSDHWDIRDIVCIVSDKEKKVGSTEGMGGIRTSPFWRERLKAVPETIDACIGAVRRKNFREFGVVVERECINMHAVMMTQEPPLFYWSDTTMRIINALVDVRSRIDFPVFFTIDAGPNVHLLCESKQEKAVESFIQTIPGIVRSYSNKPTQGARIVEDHLF